MKYLLISIPGAADHPCDELGGKTPLEAAKIPNLAAFAKTGKIGIAKIVPERLEPLPDAVFLNVLGYDADKVYTGRGPLEAANQELKLEDNEVAFRMNFITESQGVLADATGGDISTKEAKALINFLNKKVASDFVRFFSGAEYRHVAVLKDSHGYEALSARTMSPEAIIGEAIEGNLPKGPGDELLRKLMYDAKLLLQDHEINQVRVDLQENPANMIWLWGQGRPPKLEKFKEKFGLSGALVSDLEYAKGAARLAGLTVVDFPGTGAPEDDYPQRAKAAMDALADKDFVCLHLDACDEASRRGDLKAKISALETMDYFIFSKIREYLEANKETRLLVTPGHASSWRTHKPLRDAVPFLVTGKNVMSDELDKFSELVAKNSDLKINRGPELMSYFLAK